MRAELRQQQVKEYNYRCSECGGDRECACNAPAIPKAERAAEAIKANPEKSDRAIAVDIGVSPMTVNRARATVPDVTVEERTGLDGKTRRMPQKKAEPEPRVIQIRLSPRAPKTPEELAKDAMLLVAAFIRQYDKIDSKLTSAALLKLMLTPEGLEELKKFLKEEGTGNGVDTEASADARKAQAAAWADDDIRNTPLNRTA
jgi:hypothetical protein